LLYPAELRAQDGEGICHPTIAKIQHETAPVSQIEVCIRLKPRPTTILTEQQKQIEALTATVKEQSTKIQNVSEQLETCAANRPEQPTKVRQPTQASRSCVLCQAKAYDQSPIDHKGFPLHHSTGSESGEGPSPARFFASSGPAIQKSTERGKKGRTMNRLIQLKKAAPQANRLQPGGMKTLLAALALVLMGSVAWAAHIGDSVFAFVPVENRVQLVVSTDAQEITHFVLDSGVWEVSGQVNFLSLNTPAGTMFTAANISVGSLSFEPTQTASVTAEQVARLGNIIRNTSLVPRTIDVPDGTSVFLVAGSFNPNPNVTAWGFITAVKIRNHVL
jgi:hypothetical protein